MTNIPAFKTHHYHHRQPQDCSNRFLVTGGLVLLVAYMIGASSHYRDLDRLQAEALNPVDGESLTLEQQVGLWASQYLESPLDHQAETGVSSALDHFFNSAPPPAESERVSETAVSAAPEGSDGTVSRPTPSSTTPMSHPPSTVAPSQGATSSPMYGSRGRSPVASERMEVKPRRISQSNRTPLRGVENEVQRTPPRTQPVVTTPQPVAVQTPLPTPSVASGREIPLYNSPSQRIVTMREALRRGEMTPSPNLQEVRQGVKNIRYQVEGTEAVTRRRQQLEELRSQKGDALPRPMQGNGEGFSATSRPLREAN
ncbi:hypothetical protein K4A83_21365 [Spirulina subsalsa FACHB-351]|uniref:Uncharacterized protein n=1 Tax=Spirulina subsalsa FACHB-351 TaxID=234711 RepID=A0ABT3LBA8_9CYAN|nr:hypothetical protein [Spirulina subsalsa]MCW6038798.1 hypothetical protein [Spirulina subsalsa FACHB-351]